MKNNTKEIIIQAIKLGKSVSPNALVELLNISNVAVHKHLKELVERNVIKKSGSAPRVFYSVVNEVDQAENKIEIDENKRKLLEENFCYFTPSGIELNGEVGFYTFLKNTSQSKDPVARVDEYIDILKTALFHKSKEGIIDATEKLTNVFSGISIERLYFSDFYSLPKYGKTRLGQYLLHGKSGQNKTLIKTITELTKKDIEYIIKKNNIDTIAFIPHSIPRKIPFLKEYKKQLKLSLPEILMAKAFTGTIPIAQKSLSKLSERIENARDTIFVINNFKGYKNILLIDDALGSGATINETGKKLAEKGVKVFGYAIVGSYKGFEVLREV